MIQRGGKEEDSLLGDSGKGRPLNAGKQTIGNRTFLTFLCDGFLSTLLDCLS